MLSMRNSDVPLVWGLRAVSPATSHVKEHEKLQPRCPDPTADVQALPENTYLRVGLDVWRALGKRWHGNELHLHATSTIVITGLGRGVDEDSRFALRIFRAQCQQACC